VTKLANNKSSTNLQETSKSCTQPCPALCIITYWLRRILSVLSQCCHLRYHWQNLKLEERILRKKLGILSHFVTKACHNHNLKQPIYKKL
jgi:hypothetical protein